MSAGSAATVSSTQPSSSSKPTPVPPTNVVVDNASAALGAQGGEVDLNKEGVKLVVPAGVLSANATVGLQLLNNPQGLGPETTAYHVTGLAGVVQPLTLVIPTAKGLKIDEIDVFSYNAQNNKAANVPYIYDAVSGTATVTLNPAKLFVDNVQSSTGGAPRGAEMIIAPLTLAGNNSTNTGNNEAVIVFKTAGEYLDLLVRDSNERAVRCYRAVGFEIVDTGSKVLPSGERVAFHTMTLACRP